MAAFLSLAPLPTARRPRVARAQTSCSAKPESSDPQSPLPSALAAKSQAPFSFRLSPDTKLAATVGAGIAAIVAVGVVLPSAMQGSGAPSAPDADARVARPAPSPAASGDRLASGVAAEMPPARFLFGKN